MTHVLKTTAWALLAGSLVLCNGEALARWISVDPAPANPNNGASFNRYNYANNNPYKFTDPDGRDTQVELQAYIMGHAPIQGDYGHQYVFMKDTDTGETAISRAGPNAKYTGGASGALSNAAIANPNGPGKVTLQTQMQPAALSRDSDPKTGAPLGTTVPGSAVTLKEPIGQAKSTLQGFNNAVDSANIAYKPRSDNSNAYAGTAYTVLTRQPAPTSQSLPGSNVDLKPKIPACATSTVCGK